MIRYNHDYSVVKFYEKCWSKIYNKGITVSRVTLCYWDQYILVICIYVEGIFNLLSTSIQYSSKAVVRVVMSHISLATQINHNARVVAFDFATESVHIKCVTGRCQVAIWLTAYKWMIVDCHLSSFHESLSVLYELKKKSNNGDRLLGNIWNY